tara:strand:+ start:71 stop:427 length:357 start_codon:yes stop_codon:yes gene_type:complete
MAIRHITTIESIEVLNSGDHDVVSNVIVRFSSFDSDEIDRTVMEEFKMFDLQTDGRTSSSDGWVAYADLTEQTILDWLGSEYTVSKESIWKVHTQSINDILTPPAPATISKARPWTQE